MPIELPHTAGCLVCGRENPHGLHLNLHVEQSTGAVTTQFIPLPHHIGFEDIVHGGVLATVLDEAMVWTATWAGRRFCVCGEMIVRFRAGATVGQALSVTAAVNGPTRGRLVQTTAEMRSPEGVLVATASGKYVPVPPGRNLHVIGTLVKERSTASAARYLMGEAT